MEGKSKGIIVGLVFISVCNFVCIHRCEASIHEYRRESFSPQSNAFFFHGGSEGLYASKVHDSSNAVSQDKPLKGKSFIRLLTSNSFPKVSFFFLNILIISLFV